MVFFIEFRLTVILLSLPGLAVNFPGLFGTNISKYPYFIEYV